MISARYTQTPYITQTRFVFKRLIYMLPLSPVYAKGFKWTHSYGFPHRNSVRTSHLLRMKHVSGPYNVSCFGHPHEGWLVAFCFFYQQFFFNLRLSAKLRPCIFHSLFLSYHCLQFSALWTCWVGQTFTTYYQPLLSLGYSVLRLLTHRRH